MPTRLMYSVIISLIICIAIMAFICIDSGSCNTVHIVLVTILFLFLIPFTYFRTLKNMSVVPFAYRLKGNKAVLHSSLANHYINKISAGGRLYLLNDRIVFHTNLLNFMAKREVVLLISEIQDIRFESTYGIRDNDIILITASGQERFMVKDRETWKNLILKNRK